ncbi:solute carrier organic anion transporter family member 2A1 isoform X2 [Triplophysa dalaica]|uniref:solute carrier organic anion transporter family member 2A1 isoform X2 n=1 Tax=Triplophysa dalaica TaxID=1582913 RepID=UPI0024E01AC9|nr:solute carrier organic anion transporter family member 2A1 isoform X2 [Triplophysa dalaica]
MELCAEDIKKHKPALFCNIKIFVLCHGLLQLTQLMYSSYLKSTITTIERRFGLDSLSSGTISSLHEVGNTVFIVFVSYMGSRVHRPRFIGLGGLLMSISAMILALPHFLLEPYSFDSVLHASRQDMCYLQTNATGTKACGQEDSQKLADTSKFWGLIAFAQLLFGIGSVPIQPFGISYIDDFAGQGNSPLYIAILFAVSVFGPSFGYLLGSVVLRIYVDVDRADAGAALELTPSDPRWVGAWWMGLLITAGALALTSIPYFFFPRSLHVEKIFNPDAEIMKDAHNKTESSMLDFLKMFPKMLVKLLLNPLFMLLVLTQCCFSSVIAGLATFLNKFLECQYSASAAYSSLLIGALNLPSVSVGMVLGGLVMKRWGLSFRIIPRFSVAMLTISLIFCVPLFFMGCSTQDVAGVYPKTYNGNNGLLLSCTDNCSCPRSAFNPVCGENHIEYVSPCHAGCTNFTMDSKNPYRVHVFSNCQCVPDMGTAKPGPCANTCPHYLLPTMFLISLAGLIASLTHNPIYMMVLRAVPAEKKSFAIGVQFLLLRVLTWLPAPTLFGMTIDSTCIWWKNACGKKQGCGYYDNNLLRNRYLGLQVSYKTLGIILMAFIGWKMHRTREYSLEKRHDGPL